jgi:hypothetical protein
MTIYTGTIDITTPEGSGTTGQRPAGFNYVQDCKEAWVESFPSVSGAVNTTHTELNFCLGMEYPIAASLLNNTDTGGNNNYVLTISGLNTYINGLQVYIDVSTELNGNSTLNINALGAILITDTLGNVTDIPTGIKKALLIYDDTKFKLIGY